MKEMNAITLRERLEAGEPLEVVDIRETDEFESWHIYGSRNIPVYDALKSGEDVDLAARASGLSTANPVVTVCRSGVMSKRAATLLESAGFEAISLQGGEI